MLRPIIKSKVKFHGLNISFETIVKFNFIYKF
jgi:hypothetical protein